MKRLLLMLSLTFILSLSIAGCTKQNNNNVIYYNLDEEELDRSLNNDLYFEALKVLGTHHLKKQSDEALESIIESIINQVEEKIMSQHDYEDEEEAKFLIAGLDLISKQDDGNKYNFLDKIVKEANDSSNPDEVYEELINKNGKYKTSLEFVQNALSTVKYKREEQEEE